MHGSYERICEIFEEAQRIINQLEFIDKDCKKYAIIEDPLNGLDKSRGDWETTIMEPGAIICQLGLSAPHSWQKQLQSGEEDCCKTILPALLQACQYYAQLFGSMLPQTSPFWGSPAPC